MTKVLVVYCHPLETSFVAAIRDRSVAALRNAGAEVRLTDLHAEGFEPAFTKADHANHLLPGVDHSLDHHADDLIWCDMLVLVYPTWWSGQPAMLKGWIDRVWANGVAWSLPAGEHRLRPGLRNVRRIVAITTHGSAKWVNMVEGEAGKRTVTRSLRSMCHPLARTTWLACYGVDSASDSRRAAFLDKVERRLTRLARGRDRPAADGAAPAPTIGPFRRR